MKKASDRLKISLHGMNDRGKKMMGNYLEMCCHEIAQVVEESESDAEIVDLDMMGSKKIFEERLSQQPLKPIIALSVQPVSVDNAIYVKKPVDIPSIVNVIKTIKKDLLSNAKKADRFNKIAENAVKIQVKPPENSQAPKAEEPVTSAPKWTQQKEGDEKHPEEAVKTVEHSVSTPKWMQKNSDEKPQEGAVEPAGHSDPVPKPAESAENNLASETEGTEKPVESKNDSESATAETPSIHLREIDRLLKELHEASQNTDLSPKKEKSRSKQNNRQTIRYAFHPIEAKLKKNSVMNLNGSLTVLVLNISSKGAIIELKKPFKLRGKTTLTIHFDSQNIFVIPARVVRRESKVIFGLQFLSFQHKLTDYLVNSGRSFFFT